MVQNNLFWPPQPAKTEEAPSIQIGGYLRGQLVLHDWFVSGRLATPGLHDYS
jgi:hypothetical protein